MVEFLDYRRGHTFSPFTSFITKNSKTLPKQPLRFSPLAVVLPAISLYHHVLSRKSFCNNVYNQERAYKVFWPNYQL